MKSSGSNFSPQIKVEAQQSKPESKDNIKHVKPKYSSTNANLMNYQEWLTKNRTDDDQPSDSRHGYRESDDIETPFGKTPISPELNVHLKPNKLYENPDNSKKDRFQE